LVFIITLEFAIGAACVSIAAIHGAGIQIVAHPVLAAFFALRATPSCLQNTETPATSCDLSTGETRAADVRCVATGLQTKITHAVFASHRHTRQPLGAIRCLRAGGALTRSDWLTGPVLNLFIALITLLEHARGKVIHQTAFPYSSRKGTYTIVSAITAMIVTQIKAGCIRKIFIDRAVTVIICTITGFVGRFRG